jgi:hypothetical protein
MMKFFSRGNISSPDFSKGILHANQKSQLTFDRREIDAKFQSRSIPNRVKEAIGDVTASLTSALAVEIVFEPFAQ